jgi:hypothetical protein
MKISQHPAVKIGCLRIITAKTAKIGCLRIITAKNILCIFVFLQKIGCGKKAISAVYSENWVFAEVPENRVFAEVHENRFSRNSDFRSKFYSNNFAISATAYP